jgi:hypothetical protein
LTFGIYYASAEKSADLLERQLDGARWHAFAGGGDERCGREGETMKLAAKIERTRLTAVDIALCGPPPLLL